MAVVRYDSCKEWIAVQVIRNLASIFAHDPVDDETTRQLVYRMKETAGIKDSWDRRIVELGDGKSVGEIIEALYNEELQRGAQRADIGMWKHLFDRSVVEKIGELVNRGYIDVITTEVVMEERNGKHPKEA